MEKRKDKNYLGESPKKGVKAFLFYFFFLFYYHQHHDCHCTAHETPHITLIVWES